MSSRGSLVEEAETISGSSNRCSPGSIGAVDPLGGLFMIGAAEQRSKISPVSSFYRVQVCILQSLECQGSVICQMESERDV